MIPVSCEHRSTEYLGSMEDTLFHQCECGDVLISQDGRTWALPGTPDTERRTVMVEVATVAPERAPRGPARSGALRGIAGAAWRVALGMIGRRALIPESGR